MASLTCDHSDQNATIEARACNDRAAMRPPSLSKPLGVITERREAEMWPPSLSRKRRRRDASDSDGPRGSELMLAGSDTASRVVVETENCALF